ncbi:MAG: bifunctional glutamate N-acetyltransferase/amino-acid acetyltransferase ArgJ [Gammaproteobacteria bacterium]
MTSVSHKEQILPVPGLRLAAGTAGIYADARDDLALFELSAGAITAAVFTSNKFVAAPVIIAGENLHTRQPAYLLVNAGNANAGTGERGIADAREVCDALAQLADTEAAAILPFSTGVIGEYLPKEKIISQLPELLAGLNEDNWSACAGAIMTTDTRIKCCSEQLQLDGKPVTITGIAKGAGMIKPDMATMLAFIATDAVIADDTLQPILRRSVDRSFNRICVDGDTSTNDACVLIATNKAGNTGIDSDHPQLDIFEDAIQRVCLHLAQAIIRDAEGATKFVSIEIAAGRSEQECQALGFLLATSPLVKTALYASDPNWGRILAVVGRADIDDLDIRQVRIYLNDVCIVEAGGRSESYTEAQGLKVMQGQEISIRVELGRGDCNGQVWTCDLSGDYVTLNAEYRS